jgi:hypothetical protein
LVRKKGASFDSERKLRSKKEANAINFVLF